MWPLTETNAMRHGLKADHHDQHLCLWHQLLSDLHELSPLFVGHYCHHVVALIMTVLVRRWGEFEVEREISRGFLVSVVTRGWVTVFMQHCGDSLI